MCVCVCVKGICGGRQGDWDGWLKSSMLWNPAASPAFVCAWRKGWGRGRQEQEDRLLGFCSEDGEGSSAVSSPLVCLGESSESPRAALRVKHFGARRSVSWEGGDVAAVGVRVSSSDRGEAAAKTRLRPHQDSERMVVFSFFSSRGAVYSVFGEDGTELALIPFPPVSPPPWRLSPQAKWSRLGVNPAF